MSTVTLHRTQESQICRVFNYRGIDYVITHSEGTTSYAEQHYTVIDESSPWPLVKSEETVLYERQMFQRQCFESAYSERHKFRMKRKESL